MFTLTYFGYAAVLVSFEKHLLFNPGIVEAQVLVELNQVQPSYVLVSSQSDEHLGNALLFSRKKGSVIVSNSQVINILRKDGTPSYYLETLTNGKELDVGKNIKIRGFKLRRGGFLAPHNLALLVESDQGSVLHLGHTNEIGSLADSKPDLLCIPIAGKKKGSFDSEGAVIATLAIKPRFVLPLSGTADQTKSYLSLMKTKESTIIPISISVGETFTLV
ncbi:MAG: MBL fold metallo-hydrolase [Candidatus Hermodarchaeota archaeon]|nr:MBL fold metallo-hydrolase [Candidatus Hermodarchaeota archaeon]